MKQRISIDLTTEQMKALKLRWSDPDVIMAIIMAVIWTVTLAWVVWLS